MAKLLILVVGTGPEGSRADALLQGIASAVAHCGGIVHPLASDLNSDPDQIADTIRDRGGAEPAGISLHEFRIRDEAATRVCEGKSRP